MASPQGEGIVAGVLFCIARKGCDKRAELGKTRRTTAMRYTERYAHCRRPAILPSSVRLACPKEASFRSSPMKFSTKTSFFAGALRQTELRSQASFCSPTVSRLVPVPCLATYSPPLGALSFCLTAHFPGGGIDPRYCLLLFQRPTLRKLRHSLNKKCTLT